MLALKDLLVKLAQIRIDHAHMILFWLIVDDVCGTLLGAGLTNQSKYLELLGVAMILMSLKSMAKTIVAFYTKAPNKALKGDSTNEQA